VRTWFKQPTVIEFLTVEKLLPLTFTMYGDKNFDVRTVRCWVWQFNLSKNKWLKQVCVTKQDLGGQNEIQKLIKCWEMCIEAGGDYMEK